MKKSAFQLLTQQSKSLQLEHIEDESVTESEHPPPAPADQFRDTSMARPSVPEHDLSRLDGPEKSSSDHDKKPLTNKLLFLDRQDLNLIGRPDTNNNNNSISPWRGPPKTSFNVQKPAHQQRQRPPKKKKQKQERKEYDDIDEAPMPEEQHEPIEFEQLRARIAADRKPPPLPEPVVVEKYDDNIVKAVIGKRIKQDKCHYLIEKHSSTRAWKEESILMSKGYLQEVQDFNRIADHRIFCALYRKYNLKDVEVRYNRKYTINRLGVQPESITHYKGARYLPRWEAFDMKVMRRAKRSGQIMIREESYRLLDFATLKPNKHIQKFVFIKGCENQEGTVMCTYWYDGQKYSQPITEVQELYPAALSCYLFEQLKLQQKQH